MARKQVPVLGEETYGDRVHRAYRRAREKYQGPNGNAFTYASVAELISEIHPVSPPSLMRLEQLTEMPKRAAQRLTLFLALVAYGFDPEEFGFNEANMPLGSMHDFAKIKRFLDPRSTGLPRSAAEHAQHGRRVGAGHRQDDRPWAA